MIPIDQTRTDGPGGGNCLAACLASILEVPIEEIDGHLLSLDGTWWNAMQAVLRPHGLQPFSYAPGGESFPQIAPPGYHIACSATHATVAFNGRVVHDPHPRRRGLSEVTEWILLIPIAGGRAERAVLEARQHESDIVRRSFARNAATLEREWSLLTVMARWAQLLGLDADASSVEDLDLAIRAVLGGAP